jgi:Abnormal spindle-like microcephaly-assoc'd, ASPM-SPD-2-Hydin
VPVPNLYLNQIEPRSPNTIFIYMMRRLLRLSSLHKSLFIDQRAAMCCFFGFLAAVFLLTGCAGGIVSGDKPVANIGLGAAPKLVVTPTSIAFQNVVVGQKNTQTVQISNAGRAELDVSSITLIGIGAGFSLGPVVAPLKIAPGANKSFTVSFAPTAATNSAKATISIATNNATSPVSIGVQGSGVSASSSWKIAPGSLTFQSVTVQSSESLGLQLSNNGNAAVTIKSISVTGSAFSTSGLNTGTVISPNQTINFLVTFHPTAARNATGTLQLTGSSVSPLSVNLAGTSTNPNTPAPQPHSVTLNWNDSGSGIAGYRVYRGTTSGGPYVDINSSLISTRSYVDSNVASGHKYYYVVTAIGTSGNESPFSNEASATIPNP